MKTRILEVVVVCGDKGAQADQECSQRDAEFAGLVEGEAGVAHNAGCVDHGELVNQLHWVGESAVEEERAGADGEVAQEGDQVDTVVLVFDAVTDAFDSENDEEKVGEGVDELGDPVGCVVVLRKVSSIRNWEVEEIEC